MSGASIGFTDMSLIDQIAQLTLLPASWIRYLAFRNALVADRVEPEEVVEALSLFLTDLVDGHAANGVH